MTKKKTYLSLQTELHEVLDKFERSAHEDVDELLVDYEKGMKLIAELEEFLNSAQLTLKKIKK